MVARNELSTSSRPALVPIFDLQVSREHIRFRVEYNSQMSEPQDARLLVDVPVLVSMCLGPTDLMRGAWFVGSNIWTMCFSADIRAMSYFWQWFLHSYHGLAALNEAADAHALFQPTLA
jgi:hypothetical protein